MPVKAKLASLVATILLSPALTGMLCGVRRVKAARWNCNCTGDETMAKATVASLQAEIEQMKQVIRAQHDALIAQGIKLDEAHVRLDAASKIVGKLGDAHNHLRRTVVTIGKFVNSGGSNSGGSNGSSVKAVA